MQPLSPSICLPSHGYVVILVVCSLRSPTRTAAAPAHVCSKMFIGGLNWDTTDGTYIIRFVCCPLFFVVLNVWYVPRVAEKVLYAIRQG